ncbi:MAG: fatty acyl-AMP ligase [Parvularculaceae bacterium]|jgi:fatty-acyl-CoA synthase|nr:fatty acyl-AMP ligase [Parvularculaceae bacterium]
MTAAPTPTVNSQLQMKLDGFTTVTEALDYAAGGVTGFNFYNLRGEIVSALPYAKLRADATALARKLAARFARGSRIAVVAETSPEFITTFFACQYAGLLPAPMPMPVNLGGKDGYLLQIRRMIEGAKAAAAVGPTELASFLMEAANGSPDVAILDFEGLAALPDEAEATPFRPDEQCYIQYSSGSTSAPKGVIGTQSSVMANLHGITKHGLRLVQTDRAASWLPLYHDMGLIGFCLAPMYGQRSVDFLATSDFVRRPLLWLRLMSDNRTTITYSPSFGYELSARRAARAEAGAIDLSPLRVAGIGGDMVRIEALDLFAEAFAPAGFSRRAFLPSYGMAETTLAISFTDLDSDVSVDHVDMRHYTRSGIAQPASAVTSPEHRRAFVRCGRALPGHEIEVRSEDGVPLGDRAVGRIFVKGASITPGYFSDAEASRALFKGEWLDTGDMGYFLDGEIVITGRAKDLIIINGRNIWPQDIEWAVEEVDGVRQGGVAAFSVDDGHGERIVVVVERRGISAEAQDELRREIARVIQSAAGAPAEIVLAKPHSMVLTSSGKLSRAKVKQKYLEGAFDEAPAEESRLALAEARV